MWRYILGILGLLAGFALVWKANWIVANFGKVDFAEKHLGAEGGTWLFWKLMGILVIIIALLGLSGSLGGMIMGVLGPMFKGITQ